MYSMKITTEDDIPLYIVGLPKDQQNMPLISKKFAGILKRFQKVYSEIQEAKVTIKKQRTGDKKEGKYEVTIRITTPHHDPHIYSEIGFDIGKAMENLGQKLLRNLSKRAKHRDRTSVRKSNLPTESI